MEVVASTMKVFSTILVYSVQILCDVRRISGIVLEFLDIARAMHGIRADSMYSSGLLVELIIPFVL